MSIRCPGPRLFSAIRFRHLARKDHSRGQNANINLNLTPFVDMMTILVTFLLMVFSSSGEILTQQAGLELPVAVQQAEIQHAPVIIVSRQSITFNGEHMAEITSLGDAETSGWKIEQLYERLKLERTAFDRSFDNLPESQKKRCLAPEPGDPVQCQRGLAILQADKAVQARVLNRVVRTASAAGFPNLMFAVERSGGG